MNRRQLLAASSAAGAASAMPGEVAARPASGERLNVVVIGAGIMGASIAYHLTGLGAQVVVVEKVSPASQATQGAFASLITSHEEGPRAFSDLYGTAVLDWRRLDMEMAGKIPIQWGGTLVWARPGPLADQLRAKIAKSQVWGVAVEPIGAPDFARLVPGVAPGPVGAGSFSPNMGTVDPFQAATVLLLEAKRQGAQVRYPCAVTGFDMLPGRVKTVLTTEGPIAADVVVIAAGADSDRLAKMAGAQAPHSLVSGTLAHSKPYKRVLDRVLNGPDGSIKQNPDGRIVTGLDYRPGAAGVDVSQAYGESLLALAAKTVPAMAGAALDKMTIGYVPIPKDNQPIVGFCDGPKNLYIVLTMSGITMAPLMGRLAAIEITQGMAVETLAPFRPSRFA
jgi:glycine/D-amino acid oxidase-like deaminating enzyme